MTKHVKIVLNGSLDIPFDKLVLSQANVRRVKAGVSIDALAADIARRGLLQSLTVRAQRDENGEPTGFYEVPAGGRRFRALQLLVKQRKITRTQPVPCILRDDDVISAEEDSLAENTHRENLHPLDQFRGMKRLVDDGTDIETVAATFMVTPAVVKQRLRLASVSPKLLDIYAEDGMTLEQLTAFAVTEDHARQEQVWEQIRNSYQTDAYYIRRRLTEDAVHAQDRRVRFVGLDAYTEAGGYVMRDLFDDDHGGWLQDVALLEKLVDEKLQAEGARIGEEGWKWVAVAVDFAYYWFHRASHRIRWMWASHSVHHSAEQMTLLASLRLGWTNLFSAGWVFYVPLVFAGLPPFVLIALLALNLRYQFFLHTEAVGRLGPIEWVFNTPAHHRLHHASNDVYIDKNFGGVLILFDRLFGTLAHQRADEPIRYGLAHRPATTNPIRLAFREWAMMLGEAHGARGLRAKATALLAMPEAKERR